jgi:hypothetical protein
MVREMALEGLGSKVFCCDGCPVIEVGTAEAASSAVLAF